MKRVMAFGLLIIALGGFAGLRFATNGLLLIAPEGGRYSVFESGVQTYYETPPLLSPMNAEGERWDFDGDIYSQLDALDAEILKTETVSNVVVVYAYTARLPKSVNLACGKVNLMAAIGSRNSIGYPMLCGSY